MNTPECRHGRARTRHGVRLVDGADLPRESVERPHPITGEAVAFLYRDVVGDGVWTVVYAGQVLGVVVQPYSVLDDAPTVYVAIPPHVTSLVAGSYTRSWRDALACLERGRE